MYDIYKHARSSLIFWDATSPISKGQRQELLRLKSLTTKLTRQNEGLLERAPRTPWGAGWCSQGLGFPWKMEKP